MGGTNPRATFVEFTFSRINRHLTRFEKLNWRKPFPRLTRQPTFAVNPSMYSIHYIRIAGPSLVDPSSCRHHHGAYSCSVCWRAKPASDRTLGPCLPKAFWHRLKRRLKVGSCRRLLLSYTSRAWPGEANFRLRQLQANPRQCYMPLAHRRGNEVRHLGFRGRRAAGSRNANGCCRASEVKGIPERIDASFSDRL